MSSPRLQDVGLAVKRLQWRHHSTANKQLATLGISLPQWDVLRHLHDNPDASLHDLAVLTFQTDQSMGTLANRMIERGLIERVPGPGRAIRHRLTPDGDRVLAEGRDLLETVMEASLGRLSKADLATLYRLLLAASE